MSFYTSTTLARTRARPRPCGDRGALRRDDLDVRRVVCDGTPENLALLQHMRNDYIVTERQVRDDPGRLGVQACAGLVDLVREQRFQHRDQHQLRDSLRGCVVKQWAFSRSRSKAADVSPLYAAAAALYVADMVLELAGATAIEIF